MITDWRKRTLLALALFAAAISAVSQTQPRAELPCPRGLATVVPLAWLSSTPAQTIALGLVVLLLVLLVRARTIRTMQLAGIGVFFVVLALNAVGRSMTIDDVAGSQGPQYPCTTLIAWIVGTLVAERLGRDADELGTSLACGIVAAAYSMAAMSKLRAQGLGWIDAGTFALLVYERAPHAIEPIASLRDAVSASPVLCTLGMASALIVEACGWLFLFRRARRAYAFAVVAFHVASAILLGYAHPEWAFTTLAWAWAGGGVAAPRRGA